ncbi:MAG TPA: ABC transporter permease [Steroidobacteraceae bacterium]|nr:ABC transporter permease [Steroidobacteraceae bacterium]
MSLRAWRAGVRKEFLLLMHDWHALLLLFLMPLAFLVIMSLAMQDEFAQRAGQKIRVAVIDRDQSDASRALVAALSNGGTVSLRTAKAEPVLREQMNEEGDAFGIEIKQGYGRTLAQAASPLSLRVVLVVAADTTRQTELIFAGTLREILARERLTAILGPLAVLSRSGTNGFDTANSQPAIEYAYRAGSGTQAPSAVQQNVPAWLVFGAFFVVIPLSNTLIRERQQGTLRRLRTMPVGQGTLLAGKLAPYFLVNMVQVTLMMLAGCWLVPALGGEALQLHGSMIALGLVCAAVSLAALGYALLISSITRTTEQASLLGGAGNLILAAIGGIMVPKFVMPEAMQHLTNISPMAWGLEGFLDVLLRNGGTGDVLKEVAALSLFGIVTLAIAWWVQTKRAES